MLLYTLVDIIGYLINIIVILVIVQFVLSLLIAFNVVNMHNQLVASLWKAANALLEPLLRPIRRFMPDTGMLDLSPMVLIIGLVILQKILTGVALSAM